MVSNRKERTLVNKTDQENEPRSVRFYRRVDVLHTLSTAVALTFLVVLYGIFHMATSFFVVCMSIVLITFATSSIVLLKNKQLLEENRQLRKQLDAVEYPNLPDVRVPVLGEGKEPTTEQLDQFFSSDDMFDRLVFVEHMGDDLTGQPGYLFIRRVKPEGKIGEGQLDEPYGAGFCCIEFLNEFPWDRYVVQVVTSAQTPVTFAYLEEQIDG